MTPPPDKQAASKENEFMIPDEILRQGKLLGWDEDILRRQWKLANTLWLAFDQGKTLDDYYALCEKRHVRNTDMTRRVAEIAWLMWLDRQELAITLPVGEFIEIREDSLV